MAERARYNRVLLKLSGEALCTPGQRGVDPDALQTVAGEFVPLCRNGVAVGVVVGAGNVVRGRDLADSTSVHRTTADYMGMLGTVINALALRDALQSKGMDAVVVSAIRMDLICETYFRPKVMEYLAQETVVIFAGGTSHPGVTTDMAAAIRAADIEADILLKATKVDGVYDRDPQTHPDARRYETLTFQQALAERLGVMDGPAMAFCQERHLPVLVFDLFEAGNLAAAVNGEPIGSRLSTETNGH